MDKLLKYHFPTYRITDVSNRTAKDICKVIEICAKNKNILVFAVQNHINHEYIERLSQNIGINDKNKKILIFNDDNYYIYPYVDDTNIGFILSLRNKLTDKFDCIICLKHCTSVKSYVCVSCGNLCCCKCIDKKKNKCPICDNTDFVLNH